MYSAEGKFFYEILEDYRTLNNKDEIFESFCKLVWNSKNTQRIYKKDIVYHVKDSIPKNYADIFKKYSRVSYVTYDRACSDNSFDSLIRQKINNIYSIYCDRRICVKKEYFNMISTPKNMYFKFISGDKKTVNMSVCELEESIEKALRDAVEYKDKMCSGKIIVGWKAYKTLINGFLRKCFDNHKPINTNEDKNNIVWTTDFWIEDNYYIKYFCKSLTGYFKNFEKEYYGVSRGRNIEYAACEKCGGLVESSQNTKICINCFLKKTKPVKVLVCLDCELEFEAPSKANNKKRCDECQKIHVRKLKTHKQREYRKKLHQQETGN